MTAAAQRIDSLGEAHATALRLQRGAAVPSHRLDSAAMMRQGVTGMADALRRLPGVNIRDYGGAGGLKTVSVRGMGGAHTLVTEDGLPTAGGQRGAIDLSRYDISDMASLSLVNGDCASLLCPVRSLGAATLNLESLDMTGVGLTHSSWGGWSPTAGYVQQLGDATRLSFRLHYTHAENDYPYTFGGARLKRYNSRLNSVMGRASVKSQLAHGTLAGTLRYWLSDRHLPGPVIYYNPESGSERMGEQEAVASLRWESRMEGKVQWQAAGKYAYERSRYTNHSTAPMGPPRQCYDEQEGYATAGLIWRPLAGVGVAYAADYTLQGLHSNLATDNDVVRHWLQQALSLEWKAGRLGARVRLIDHLLVSHVAGGEAARTIHRLTPSVSATYSPTPRLTLRAYYKGYFRPPTFTESYYYHLGSPSLRPELTRQGGIGAEGVLAKGLLRMTYSVDAYMGSVRDRIVSIPYNLFVWRTVNRDHVQTAGLELAASASWRGLTLSGNYTLQHAKADARQLPYTPRHTGSVALCWENPWVNAALSSTFASERSTTLTPSVPSTILPRYYEMNLSLWHCFPLPRFHSVMTLRGDVLNLTDQRYFVIARYPMPGTSYRITLQLNIK